MFYDFFPVPVRTIQMETILVNKLLTYSAYRHSENQEIKSHTPFAFYQSSLLSHAVIAHSINIFLETQLLDFGCKDILVPIIKILDDFNTRNKVNKNLRIIGTQWVRYPTACDVIAPGHFPRISARFPGVTDPRGHDLSSGHYFGNNSEPFRVLLLLVFFSFLGIFVRI